MFVISNATIGYTGLVGLAIVVIAAARDRERNRLNQKRMRFKDRLPMQPEAIFAEYFTPASFSVDVFQREWLIVATKLRLDHTLLRPGDRFDAELSPAEDFFSADEMEEAIDYYRSAWLKAGNRGEPPVCHSLMDLMKTLCELPQLQQTASR